MHNNSLGVLDAIISWFVIVGVCALYIFFTRYAVVGSPTFSTEVLEVVSTSAILSSHNKSCTIIIARSDEGIEYAFPRVPTKFAYNLDIGDPLVINIITDGDGTQHIWIDKDYLGEGKHV